MSLTDNQISAKFVISKHLKISAKTLKYQRIVHLN
jgi:hypothetical protein